jgi:hypothetical protein
MEESIACDGSLEHRFRTRRPPRYTSGVLAVRCRINSGEGCSALPPLQPPILPDGFRFPSMRAVPSRNALPEKHLSRSAPDTETRPR